MMPETMGRGLVQIDREAGMCLSSRGYFGGFDFYRTQRMGRLDGVEMIIGSWGFLGGWLCGSGSNGYR